MNSKSKYNFLSLGMLVAYAALSGCTNSGLSSSGSLYNTNTGTTAVSTSTISLSPGSASVSANGSVQFSASGGTAPYTYSVISPVSGGGSITSDGFYTAPSTTVAVEIGVTDANSTYAFATVSVTATTSTTATLTLTLTAASTSLNVGTGTQLTASGGTAPYTYAIYLPASGGGTITTSGLYTAPSSITSSGFVVDAEVTDAAGNKAYASLTITNAATATSCEGNFSAIFNGSQYSMSIIEDAAGAIAGSMTWVRGGTQAIVGSCLNGTITFARSGTDQIMTGTYTGTTGALTIAGTFTGGGGSYSWSAVSVQ